MIGPKIIVLFAIVLWLTIAAVVIGYPLLTGRIRAGLDTVNRESDPQAFWKAYVYSTALFIGVSVAAGFFLHSMLHWKS